MRRWRWVAILGLAGLTGWAAEAAMELILAERFGVSHPPQIVEFRLARPVKTGAVRVTDETGAEVVAQVVEDGRAILLQTGLAAGATRRWQVVAGQPSAVEGEVSVEADFDLPAPTPGAGGGGLPMLALGSRQFTIFVPTRPDALPAGRRPIQPPWEVPAEELLVVPAPVQVLSGTAGDIPLASRQNGLGIRARRLERLTATVVEAGPLRAVAKVRYEVETGEYRYGETVVREAGPGFYECTIRLDAGQPAVLFTEHADVDFAWGFDVYGAVRPDRARYQGHHASRPEFGTGADGGIYKPWHERGNEEATVALQYERPVLAGYTTNRELRRWMAIWDPWCTDTGWYWQLYREDAPPEAPMVGIFAGAASLAKGAAASGTGIATLPPAGPGRPPQCAIVVQSYRRGPDGRIAPYSRWQWGLWAGTKGADLRPPKEVQGIGLAMNRYNALNLTKLAAMSTEFADPPRGYGALYMEREALQARIERLRADPAGPHGKGYHAYLYAADPTSRLLVDFWKDETGARRQAAFEGVMKTARELVEAAASGHGLYDFHYHYWHGGLAMMRHGLWIDQLLADPHLPADRRASLQAAAVLFGTVLWDDDYVPLFDGHGLNLGTANMPVQQTGYRHFYALFLAGHPGFAGRAERVDREARAMVDRLVNEHGAQIGCPHYIAASMAPTLSTLMQLRQLGRDDPFEGERLRRFAEFYLNLLTPPEPRAGGRRCFVSLGDSSTEPSELYGVLGTAFQDADPALAGRLMGAWEAGGKPQSGFFGTTYLMIDERIQASRIGLGSASFPGYLAVLRQGFDTPDEAAVWLVAGEHYADHRHADRGSLVIYAMGVPVSLDWGSIYTPHVPGPYYHSGVVLESMLGHAWNADSPPLAGEGWARSELVGGGESWAEARMTRGGTTWRRRVELATEPGVSSSVIVTDTFDGEGAAAPKIWSLNLAATGKVTTPFGEVEPVQRTHPAENHQPGMAGHELASASPVIELPAAAVPYRFGFTPAFASNDRTLTVLVTCDEPQQAVIGNWGVSAWGGHLTTREERQHILRLRGTRFRVEVKMSRQQAAE